MKRIPLIFCLTIAVLLGSVGESFALPECKDSPTQDPGVSASWDQCKGTRIYSDGKRYSGDYKSGRPDGRGTLIDSQGIEFDGKFISGYLDGKFTITKSDGCALTGNFKESKAIGKYNLILPGVHLPRCTKTMLSGKRCFGEWKNYYGDTYIGEFKIKNEGNNIKVPKPNTKKITISERNNLILGGTYYLSCWMTMAQIEQMRAKKVMF